MTKAQQDVAVGIDGFFKRLILESSKLVFRPDRQLPSPESLAPNFGDVKFHTAVESLPKFAANIEDIGTSVAEQVFMEVLRYTVWAVDGDRVLVSTPVGRVLFTKIDGDGLIAVDFVPNRPLSLDGAHCEEERCLWVIKRYAVWFTMSRESLKVIGDLFRNDPKKRVPFEVIFGTGDAPLRGM
jgi:hypothetical protein